LNQSIHLNEALRIRAYQKGRSAAEDETQEPPGHQFHESLSIYLANRFGEVRPSTVVMEHSAWEYGAEGAGAGAGIGATVGGAAGLLAGLGLLAIPGLGPVVAAGWLASTAVGALAGGATGGIIGALTRAGVKDEDAQLYAEGIRRGGTLVSARVPDGDRARYESVLDRSAVNLKERSAAYQKAGWNRFNPNAPPLSADQIRKERELYRRSSAA
jgi:hypothetical protein